MLSSSLNLTDALSDSDMLVDTDADSLALMLADVLSLIEALWLMLYDSEMLSS